MFAFYCLSLIYTHKSLNNFVKDEFVMNSQEKYPKQAKWSTWRSEWNWGASCRKWWRIMVAAASKSTLTLIIGLKWFWIFFLPIPACHQSAIRKIQHSSFFIILNICPCLSETPLNFLDSLDSFPLCFGGLFMGSPMGNLFSKLEILMFKIKMTLWKSDIM